jgi:hypothetical protein
MRQRRGSCRGSRMDGWMAGRNNRVPCMRVQRRASSVSSSWTSACRETGETTWPLGGRARATCGFLICRGADGCCFGAVGLDSDAWHRVRPEGAAAAPHRRDLHIRPANRYRFGSGGVTVPRSCLAPKSKPNVRRWWARTRDQSMLDLRSEGSIRVDTSRLRP